YFIAIVASLSLSCVVRAADPAPAAAVPAAAPAPAATIPPASTMKDVTFDAHIKPIFDKACVNCHGPKKSSGGLKLDSLANTLKGGEEGKVLTPGSGEKSALVRATARVKGIKAMPPNNKGEPLTAEQVGLIRAWIDQGAK